MPRNLTFRLLPLLFLGLIIGGSPALGGTPNTNEAIQRLPTVNEIFEKSIQATGGRAHWLKLTSMRLRADLSDATAKGMAGKLEILSKAPDKISECITLSNVGYFACRAYDGKTGWGDDSREGLVALDGPRLEEIRTDAVFYAELSRGSAYSDLKVKGQEVFDGTPVFVLAGTRKDGRKQELYFAKETGFQVGSKELGQTGADSKTNYFKDYKELEGVGVKIPTKFRTVNSQMDLQIAVYEIVPNAPIADSVFSKPAKSARDAKDAGIDRRPDNGRVVDGVYANEFFGLSYTLPQGWTVHGEETQKVILETGKEIVAGEDQNKKRVMEAASKRTFQLLTVFEYPLGTPGKTNRGIQVMAENVAFAPGIQTGKDYLQVMQKNLSTSQVHFEFEGEPVEETLDGIAFYHNYGHFQVSGKTVHEVFYATMLKGYALSVVFSASSKEAVDESAKSIASVRRQPAGPSKP
jgi:hypothetical protein